VIGESLHLLLAQAPVRRSSYMPDYMREVCCGEQAGSLAEPVISQVISG